MAEAATSNRLARTSLLSLLVAAFCFVVPYVAAQFGIGLGIQPVAVIAWGICGIALLLALITGTAAMRQRRVVLFWVVPLWLAILLALVQTCVGW